MHIIHKYFNETVFVKNIFCYLHNLEEKGMNVLGPITWMGA